MSIERKTRHLITAVGVASVVTAACFGPNSRQADSIDPVAFSTPVRPELAPPDWSRRSYGAPFSTPVRPELASMEWIRENYQISELPGVSEEGQAPK